MVPGIRSADAWLQDPDHRSDRTSCQSHRPGPGGRQRGLGHRPVHQRGGARGTWRSRGCGARPSTWPPASLTGLPSDFDYVLNLAVAKSGDWEKDLAANAESVGLLMAHCRNAKAFLHCSSAAVYDPPDDEPRTERAALGDNHKPLFPTYSISKIAGEVVARTMARALDVPTTIARLNVPYGDNGGWPFYHMEMMLAGIPIPVPAGIPARYNPIHEDDIIATIPKLLDGGVGAGDHTQLVRRADRQPAGVVRLPRFAGRQGTSLRGERAGVARQSHRRETDARARSAPPRSTGTTESAGWRPNSTRSWSASAAA